MGQQRAGERAKRSALEAELAELSAASKAQSGEGATNARELVRLRRELFFFQAEDGIRDADVTGVQTCALPISKPARPDWQRRIGRKYPVRWPSPPATAMASLPPPEPISTTGQPAAWRPSLAFPMPFFCLYYRAITLMMSAFSRQNR